MSAAAGSKRNLREDVEALAAQLGELRGVLRVCQRAAMLEDDVLDDALPDALLGATAMVESIKARVEQLYSSVKPEVTP